MEEYASTIRGLINDLTRTLTGSLVHMDDLLLQLDNDSGEFDDAWLANHQLERALEFFIELRSRFFIRQGCINQRQIESYKLTGTETLLHNFNNLLAVVVGYCDIIQNDIADVPNISHILEDIYKSIQNAHYSSNKTICLPERNYSINKKSITNKNNKLTKIASHKKNNVTNRILLVEDDKKVNKVISTVLRKNYYTVVGCYRGDKALAVFTRLKGKFVFCVVDVGLPDVKGPDLVEKFLLLKPDINIIFISGYSEGILRKQYSLIGPYPILIKPFRVEEILNKMTSTVIH
jgi:CheY-like chemotaxis protein